MLVRILKIKGDYNDKKAAAEMKHKPSACISTCPVKNRK